LSLDAECIVIVGDYIGGVISVSLMHLAWKRVNSWLILSGMKESVINQNSVSLQK
jgi:hypothetical protein